MFVSQNKLSQIRLNLESSLLEWNWHLDTGYLEKTAFEQSFFRFNALVNMHFFDKILLDVHSFEKVIDYQTQNWIKDNFFRKVDFKHINSLALVSSKDLLAQKSIERMLIAQIPNHISIELFTNSQKARTWLKLLK